MSDRYTLRDFQCKLDGGGRVNQSDAAMVLSVAEEIDESPEWGWLKGGTGAYRASKVHGPFVHVDTRGFVARWGAVR